MTRETPSGIVFPILGSGTPGAGMAGTGGGAVGAVLPATLSQTGAFSDLTRLTPVRGLVPFEPNAVLWSDHATKTRWFALTSATSVMGYQRDARWTIPVGAVWVKHFDLELRRGDPTSVRRVETRFLLRPPNDPEGRVTGYTYRWNDAQTDATLVPMVGDTQVFRITEDGVTREQTWTFPARIDCQTCHNSVGGPILSFNTRQLNRPGRDGTNQIVALARAGYLSVSSVPDPATLPTLVDAADTTHPLEHRVRSYLDVNCSQCHRPGVGNAGAFALLQNTGAFDARLSTPLSLAGIVNGALSVPAGEAAHRVVVPGVPDQSQLLQRMRTRGTTQMPPLATRERDLAGEALVAEWIRELGQPKPASSLRNVSARGQAGGSAGPLISGFVVAPGGAKTLLVRAIGPALARFGINDALPIPVLTIFDSAGRAIAANTGWGSAPNAGEIRLAAAQLGGFPLIDGSGDSALLVSLPAGGYTAHVSDAGIATGTTLLEIYDGDADPASPAPRLVNSSVRALVSAGGRVVISGIVVGPGATKTVLIRAIGPGLAAHRVPGPLLADPVIALFAQSEPFVTNARWTSAANASEIRTVTQRSGALALNENGTDSAMLVTLSPGAYTVQATSATAGAGMVLLEMFEIP